MHSDGPDFHLILFFTQGVSLKTWSTVGMLEREMAIYRNLTSAGAKIRFVTYDKSGRYSHLGELSGVRVSHNRLRLPTPLYSRLLPFIHGKALSAATVFKTNQIRGSEAAVTAARLWKKPLIIRCGYVWSELARHGGLDRAEEAKRAQRVESKVFKFADRVVVTTSSMRDLLIERYGLSIDKLRIVPNYVLTDIFSPTNRDPVSGRISFVGRLGREKDPISIVRACEGFDVEIVMVGDGPYRREIGEIAKKLRVRVDLMGNVPHKQLPKILRSSELFVLVSPHEGHPKALLEAMACGVPVLGADSPGIREIIQHGENGWLVERNQQSIREGIKTLLDDPSLRRKLASNGRRFVVENFSLERVFELESAVLREAIARRR